MKNMGLERKVRVGEVVLRVVIFLLGALAAALVGTDSQSRTFFSLQKTARFTDMKALVFLMVANGVASGYSLVQGVRCAVSMARGTVLLNKALAWSIFFCDQVLAYAMLAAVAAALQSAVVGKAGLPVLQWMEICSLYGRFCTRVGEGVASSVVATVAMVLLSFVSAFKLFRLYGGGDSSRAISATATW